MSDRPQIKAVFSLDAEGKPQGIEQNGFRHYHIQLQVENAPKDTYAVTYLLDPTYYEPVREVRNSKESFAADLTSYGDYTIQAKIRTPQGVTTIATPLSRALERGHHDITAAIDQALGQIRKL